jgi:hypothetical protein
MLDVMKVSPRLIHGIMMVVPSNHDGKQMNVHFIC